MTHIEAMKLALDWFKCYKDGSMSRNNAEALADEVVEALEEALAKQEQDKPYGYVRADGKGLFIYGEHQFQETEGIELVPVYLRSKQEQGEPVAWRHKGQPWQFKTNYCINLPDVVPESWEPLYTTPQQRTWVGLTDEEIYSEYVRFEIQGGFNRFEYAIKAIEAKLKEKNT